MTGRASRSFKGGCARLVKLVGKAVEAAYHGSIPIDQASAIPVEGAHELQGFRHSPRWKGFIVIDLGPILSLFFYILGQLLNSMDQKCFFDKGVVEKQGGATIVLTSLTLKTVLGGCHLPCPVHGCVTISELVE